MRNKAIRGLAALLLALAFLRCAPEATSGPCVFVNAEREFTLRNTFDYADVACRGEGGNEVLILSPPPWQVYMIEIARPVRRGREILLDRRYHLGRTSDFGPGGTPAPRPPSR